MNEADLRAHFDRRAERYDNPVTAFIGERELRQIRPMVPAGSTVLDYGCGTGRTTLDLLRRGCAVTAFDISSEMAVRAKRRAERLALRAEFTCEARELEGRQWPIVTCIGVLDYYPDPSPLLEAVRARLAPGGCLVMTVPNAYSPLAWVYAAGSRFTYPAQPRTPSFVFQAAFRAGLRVSAMRCAFPSIPPLGMTWVFSLHSLTGPGESELPQLLGGTPRGGNPRPQGARPSPG